VVIAAEGNGRRVLQEAFPSLAIVPLKGYGLTYSSWLPAWLKIILQLPGILASAIAEHRALKKIIREHQIDVVISDNRFGLRNKNIFAVYITHQVMIKCPAGLKWLEPLVHRIHGRIIRKYDACWIPDYAGVVNLSGDLSHRYPLSENAQFIQPLSRFGGIAAPENFEYDLCVILSGPEPGRSIFERKILPVIAAYEGRTLVILGRPLETRDESDGRCRIVSHLNAGKLERAIVSSKYVICRPGYSSVMDLAALKKMRCLFRRRDKRSRNTWRNIYHRMNRLLCPCNR
jgi:hypothetical protein